MSLILRLQNRIRFTFFIGLTWLTASSIYSQDVQLWLDAFGYKQLGKSFEYEGNIGYNKLLQKDGWADYYFTNTFTWDIAKWYNLEGSVEMHFTYDPESSNIGELRLFLGQKIIFFPYIKLLRLDKPYFYWRLEERILNYTDVDTIDYKTRLRLRLGSRVLINNTKLVEKTYYIPFYVESFFNFNGEAFERYAAKSRTAVGLGYVFNTKMRGEFIHYIQWSSNTTEDSIHRTDVIFQFKFLYYFDG